MLVEWRQILQRLEVRCDGEIATLVGVEGSSYRRVGARLLVGEAGEQAGSISGGCLEGELLKRAKWLIRNGPVVQHYSTAMDEEDEIPFGLGCGGELDVLLEDANSVEVRALLAEVKQVLEGAARRVVTWLPREGRALRRAIFSLEGELRFASSGLTAEELGWAAGLEPGEGGAEVFVEELRPPQRLFVMGAGEDARPMVTLAAMLGWNVTVADGRRQLARAERFPEAQRVMAADSAGRDVRGEDAVILMTHSYEQDRDLLAALLPARPRYLGLLGARQRSSLLLRDAAAALGRSLAECCAQVHAPVGLDLGGDGAEAIALATIAEVQAAVQGKVGNSRRLTVEEVLAQVVKEEAGRQYRRAQCAL